MEEANEPLLAVHHLVKTFKETPAVQDVSFNIYRGECVGLLGPNGAGKTTTLEMIEGLQTPSSGQISFAGQPLSSAFREQMGIQFQHTSLPDYLTVYEVLVLFSRLYHHTLPLSTVIEQCALQDVHDRDHRKLSGGQRQRLLLALAILNDPELVFLDEPTTGLDPQARHHFWSLVQGLKKQGKTLLLTTHYMDEAAMLCDRLLIIEAGKIIAEGAPTQLLHEHFSGVVVRLPMRYQSQLPAEFDWEEQGNIVQCTTDDVGQLIAALQDHQLDLRALTIREPNLEDLFLKLTGRALRG